MRHSLLFEKRKCTNIRSYIRKLGGLIVGLEFEDTLLALHLERISHCAKPVDIALVTPQQHCWCQQRQHL